MAYIPQPSPEIMSRYADGSPSKPAARFPQNLAANMRPETAKKMLMWLSTKYIWPQIQERMPFEAQWDKILNMSRVMTPASDLFKNTQQDASKAKQDSDQSNRDKARVSDTVIHDAIQKLTDITAFIAFKEGLPAQFAVPEYVKQPYSTKEYTPLDDKIAGGNALLQWNSANNHVRRNSLLLYRHHYTYGLGFVMSDYRFKIELNQRQTNQGQLQQVPEITEIGTTFEPISLRKIWMNWRLPVYNMEMQPCPFFFEETSRFALMQNAYDSVNNPFGYVNFEKLMKGEYIYTGPEMSSVRDALQKVVSQNEMNSGPSASSVAQILEPKYSVEAKWTLFPIMPYDPVTDEFEMQSDGKTPIPATRFVMETWGPNIHSGAQIIVRLQTNYYPKNKLPLYGSVHMPSLDDGLYSPSIGQILENHYLEMTLCMEQYFTNKDLMNDPPSWHLTSSPCGDVNRNKKGAKIPVNGANDFGWARIPDATNSTVAMKQMLREEAQTTSKTVDAIMGKAMGARTSASEANNAFEAGMSAITTDIDMLSNDIHGEGYARRVWDYSGLWMDPDLLQCITGQLGFMLSSEDMWLNIGLKTNAGSTYVEKIVKQQSYRYILESSRGEIALDRPKLWRLLLDEMQLDGSAIVEDQGREQQIQFATLQACQTYLGYPVMVDPDQDHQLAVRIKSQFIKDRTSVWNTSEQYAVNAPALIAQIQQHQWFVQLQMQMQLVQEQMRVAQAQLGIHQENPPPLPSESGGGGTNPVRTSGQVAQQGAGA